MRKIFLFIAIGLSFIVSAAISPRLVFQGEEIEEMQLGEIGGLGLVAYLGGDSVMLLDDDNLDILHLPLMSDARQILMTDSALFCSIDNYVCQYDTITNSLKDVMILDNDDFILYPACGNSFFVLTADDEWSSCLLADPENETYSETLQYPGLIRKVVSSREHCFVWIGDDVCLVGPDQQLATLFNDPALHDIALTPSGLVVAMEDGLFVVASPSRIYQLSDAKIKKLWYVDGSLYLLGANNTLIALDDFVYPESE